MPKGIPGVHRKVPAPSICLLTEGTGTLTCCGPWSRRLRPWGLGTCLAPTAVHIRVVPAGRSSVASCSGLSWRLHLGPEEDLAVEPWGLGWVASRQRSPSSPLLLPSVLTACRAQHCELGPVQRRHCEPPALGWHASEGWMEGRVGKWYTCEETGGAIGKGGGRPFGGERGGEQTREGGETQWHLAKPVSACLWWWWW